MLQTASLQRPQEPASYVRRVCSLPDFLMYCPDDALLRPGSRSLLDRQLRSQLALALPALRPSQARVAAAAGAPAASAAASGEAGQLAVPAYMLPTGIPRPPLGGADVGSGASGSDPEEQWERMAMLLAVCTAGLVRYLLDCGPEEPPPGYSTDA